MNETREASLLKGREMQMLPLIGLREMILFPKTVRPFVVGRPASLAAVNEAMLQDRLVFLALQKDPLLEEPAPADLHRVGVIASIMQALALPNGHVKLLVEGRQKGVIQDFLMDGATPHVSVLPAEEPLGKVDEIEPLLSQAERLFADLARKQASSSSEPGAGAFTPEDPVAYCYQMASQLQASASLKQKVIEAPSLADRLVLLRRLVTDELDLISLDQRLNKEVEKQIEKAQREYYLNEKMKLIKKELGREDAATDAEELKARIEKAGMPDAAKDKALQELRRLEFMPPVSAEATVAKSYIDWLLALPWTNESKDKTDVKRAAAILDEDHYGLEKVKERILEFLSVRILASEHKGSILCFVGPPGVGKTSVAKSIARSMGREFVRLSLGGVHDEAEIKGHRRTYIGSFPGQMIQLIRRAGTKNPVFLLDEIDKLGSDFRGDPSSALLEVLDPEQNSAFVDHYIDVAFDFSKVFFITTANVTHTIPPALLDRMEVVNFSGYTLPEKLAIAKQYLAPKQRKSHGLKEKEVLLTDEGLEFLIDGYTREAGVRNLEREIAAVCRKVAHRVVREHKRQKLLVTPKIVEELLGVPRYKERKVLNEDQVGVAVGLAWTQNGGDILLIEASLMPGDGNLILTGQMGDVMQESARAALSFIRGNAEKLGLKADFFAKNDVHVHIPEGAIPKDGPSAGITMAVAMASAFTKIAACHTIAMTGEVTLRGKVLPVGGLREKILAARQHDLLHVIIPSENEKDIAEIPANLREGMTFHPVATLKEVLALALVSDPFRPVPPPPSESVDAPQPGKHS
jgi:ATP-dependent Lon protease